MFSVFKKLLKKFIKKQEAESPESAPKKPSEKNKKIKADLHKAPVAAKKLDHNGILVLKSNENLNQYFKDDVSEKTSESLKPPVKKPRKRVRLKQKSKPSKNKKNKNGIPILDTNTDLTRIFKDDSDETPFIAKTPQKKLSPKPCENKFADLLEKNIAGKSHQELLKAKGGPASQKRPLTKAQKIKRYYPMPQEEVDLHGCTSEEAIKKTDEFIREAYRKGKRTLLIIVGKGLHSQGRAVLPDVVEAKIIDMKHDHWVFAFEWEKRDKYKSGAIIVYLNIKV